MVDQISGDSLQFDPFTFGNEVLKTIDASFFLGIAATGNKGGKTLSKTRRIFHFSISYCIPPPPGVYGINKVTAFVFGIQYRHYNFQRIFLFPSNTLGYNIRFECNRQFQTIQIKAHVKKPYTVNALPFIRFDFEKFFTSIYLEVKMRETAVGLIWRCNYMPYINILNI